jgi:hypothetical protein
MNVAKNIVEQPVKPAEPACEALDLPPEYCHYQDEGYDPLGSEPLIVDSFDFSQIEKLYDRLQYLTDSNLGTVAQAQERGEACLRKSVIASLSGSVKIPVNCGQQLYDVVAITNSRAGLSAAKRRVLGLAFSYRPQRGEYEQRLLLGAV